MKYKTAKGWSNFGNIVEMEVTGIQFPMNIEKTNMKEFIYNIQGRHLSTMPQKGFYIIRQSNGSTKKVFVR